MPKIEFTKISSKGQVVIPTRIRSELGLKEGTPLAVIGKNGSIVLKKIDMPKVNTWDKATKPFRIAAKSSEFKKKELKRLILEVRRQTNG